MNVESIFNKADQCAQKAFDACVPTPMVVGQASGLFGSGMVAGTEEVIDDGVCGFAWVQINPARGDFVNFCKRNNIGDKGTYKGWTISMGTYGNRYNGQSMERKEAAGTAFADVLKSHGINAFMTSRMD